MAKIGRRQTTLGSDLRDLAEFKKLLGDLAQEYNDTQIRRIQQGMFTLAEILLGLYESKREQQTKARRERSIDGFDSSHSESYDEGDNAP